MLMLILIALLVLLVLAPQFWTRFILNKYKAERTDFPGTGGELAQHLIKKFELTHVRVESTALGDHYDPQSKKVRLTEDVLNGKSLTAVATAAHEVGHAIQDAQQYRLLGLRTKLVKLSILAERAAPIALIAAPALTPINPLLGRLLFIAALASMALAVLVHLVTLPVELDASFNKALPILRQGNYVEENDYKTTRKILGACAMTYVSGSLASLLNFWRWLRLLRR